mmetsp:Transcript_20800/g.30558  ORF Transcript_20800/g.30558 Transcript_20800/m.30558 type:complete len:311 (-) Transcript_20800:84-1016(-)
MPSLRSDIFDEIDTIKALTEEIEILKKKCADAEKTANRLKTCAKFDKAARDGQVKRARLIEHELTVVKNDNSLQARLREEAEQQAKAVDGSLQRERALRLQDMHERRQIQISMSQLKQKQKDGERNLSAQRDETRKLSSKFVGLNSALRSQATIIEGCDREVIGNEAEIESLKIENAQLRMKLEEANTESLYHMDIRERLEKECHRLRTLAMSKKGHRENLTTSAKKIPSLALEKVIGRSPSSKTKSTSDTWNRESTRQVACSDPEELSLADLSKHLREWEDKGKKNNLDTSLAKVAWSVRLNDHLPSGK